MAVSEMVSSHAILHRNARTISEMLRIDPRERTPGAGGWAGRIIQLFGEDPDTMRSAAAFVAARGADAIDINMGCPVPKVRKTGAGAELLSDPDRAVALARAAVEGAAQADRVPCRSPSSCARPAPRREQRLRRRPPAGRRGRGLCDRLPSPLCRGAPQRYARLRARRAARRDAAAPVILTGGLDDAEGVREAFEGPAPPP